MRPASVVIPTYNGARFIHEALASVFAQTALPQEIIVVDDCSTDGTAEIVERIGQSAPVPVRLFRQTKNSGGPAHPINLGVRAAKGKYIAVLDQDDVLVPDKIERQTRALSENSDVALAGGFCSLEREQPAALAWQFEALFDLGGMNIGEYQLFCGRDVLRMLILRGNFLMGYPAFMFRKAHWQAKGGVDESLRIASDCDLMCWLCTQGSVALFPVVQYVRCEHNANVCNDKQQMFLDIARVRARYLAGQRWLLEDQSVSRPLREWFAGFSYWLRQASNYRGSWDCYRLMAQVWGWDWSLRKAACKLVLHHIWRQLTREPPVYNSWTRPR